MKRAIYPGSFDPVTVGHLDIISRSAQIFDEVIVTDFEYELQMSQTNRQICPEVDTLFLTASVEYSYVSSSTVKEIAYYGGDISAFVPDFVAKEVKKRFSS